MRLAIMQPYWFPYLGYFQLLNAADEFVVYDDIQYTKRGWINRNRVLAQGQPVTITLPLKSGQHLLNIIDRELAESWEEQRSKLLSRLTAYYRRAPHFAEVFPVLERCLRHEERNLFRFLLFSLQEMKVFLGITTPIVVSSTIPIPSGLQAEQRVIAICRSRGATEYLNPAGGRALYDPLVFAAHGIQLRFGELAAVEYQQFGAPFVPALSIIDVAMFNDRARIGEFLSAHYLVR